MNLTAEVFDRMDGLVNIAPTKQLQHAIASITIALVADGFEQEEIEAYLGRTTRWTIDEVIDDLA